MTRLEKFTDEELRTLNAAITDYIESGLIDFDDEDGYDDLNDERTPSLLIDSLYNEIQDELSLRGEDDPAGDEEDSEE
jgi:hypothetical protein